MKRAHCNTKRIPVFCSREYNILLSYVPPFPPFMLPPHQLWCGAPWPGFADQPLRPSFPPRSPLPSLPLFPRRSLPSVCVRVLCLFHFSFSKCYYFVVGLAFGFDFGIVFVFCCGLDFLFRFLFCSGFVFVFRVLWFFLRFCFRYRFIYSNVFGFIFVSVSILVF